MAKKRKRVDYDSPLMNIYSPEYQYLMKQNAPENANVAGLGDWFSNLFRRNKQQPDYHRDTVSMGLGTENSLQGVGNGGIDWNNQNFNLTNQQQFNYDPNQELTTSQQYQNTLKDPENLAPKQTEQSTQPSAGSNVNWGGVIGTAATATANAISNGGSAADIAANAMGIPVLAKMWKANTEKGDANIKSAQEAIASVQDNKYIQDANSLQGVGNALKLNMSNKPKMIDTSGFQRMTNWKDFSSGRGSGTWWKNMATAQLQGAASGSVGGPWGALGGATAGLLGSIGGLFDSKKRAKRAMNEYNQRMDSLRAYATAENLRRKADYELSNQNAIHNGLGQQSIKEMSNFRAMGGNLYTDLSPNMMNLWNDKQNIDKQKIVNQQMNFGLGNSFNQKLNTFDYGGSMSGMDLPTDMQYYENGGSHEQNPYGGIQVGVDQQGNPNLVEEGEFRYGDYIFSDRIPVDYSILSDFNVEKGKSNRNTKNNPTYAELAKKTADKYKGLNDKISKDSLNKQLDRLQQSQEAQKFKEQQDQQYTDYTNALKNPTQGNPMYGNMKYNGMGNANQGINAGVDEGVSNAMDNSDLSNVNRSGNPMMAAYGGNLFAIGGNAINNPKKILPWEEPMNLEYRTTVPQANTLAGININTNPYYGNVRDHQQLLINNGYNIVPDGMYGPATENAMTDFRHKIYGQSQAGTQTVNNSNSNSTYSSDKKYVKYDVPINQDSQESETGEVTNSTKTNSSVDDVVPVENLGEVNKQQGNLAGSSPFVWNRYNEAGKYSQLAKGLVPNLMNWSGQTNWNYNPDWRPSNKLEALGHSSYANRTADHLGDYIAPNLMDLERLNNATMAQTAAQQRGIQNISGGNRGFVGAQNAATDYNGQMGIGNNYATTEQYNAEQQQKAAEFNRATNQFNAQANNDMYRDNLNAWMQGRQMDIQAMEAANRERQFERQYKDKVDRDAALNKQKDLAAMFDNTMNFLADEAEYNRRLNDMNSRRNSRFWYDKKEGWQERNDNGFTSKLNAAIDGAILSSDDFNQISKIQNNDKYTDDEKIAMIQNIADSARARNKQENDAIAAEKKKEIQNYLSEAQSYFNSLNGLQGYQPWENAKNRYSDPNYFTYTDDLSKEIAKHRMDELQNMWFNYTTRYNPNAVAEVPTSQTIKTGKTNAYGGKLKRKREYDYMSI